MNADITGKSTNDRKSKKRKFTKNDNASNNNEEENGCQLSLNIMGDIKASEILPLVSEKANLFTGNLKVSSSNIKKLQNVLLMLQEKKLTHQIDMTEITQEKVFGTVLKVRTGSPALTKIEEESLMKEMKSSSISVLRTNSDEFSGYYRLDYDDDESADTILDMQKNNSKFKFLDRSILIGRFREQIISSFKNESKKRKRK